MSGGARDQPRRARPAAPQPGSLHGRPQDVVIRDEGDAAIVPAPEPSAFAARHVAPARAGARLFFRRTMIPILLTCGVLFAALAGMWFNLDQDSTLRTGTGIWLPAAVAVLSVVLLCLAVLNMLQVRHLLQQHAADRRTR